jgi:siderophore synthetase component
MRGLKKPFLKEAQTQRGLRQTHIFAYVPEFHVASTQLGYIAARKDIVTMVDDIHP